MLGDLNAQKRTSNGNVRLLFEQGFVHEQYLTHLFELFKSYCLAAPKIANRLPNKRTGNIYTRITFSTFSLPCFNDIYNLFYLDGKKIIPLNIAELFTVYSLSYWLCDDGSFCKTRSIVTLCTESFTLEEVTLLANTLNDKWDLNCYINKTNNNGYRIIIPRKSLSILQGLLKDIMPF
uniref:LAGLIDADG homing endonuclease n=1 Tax=Rhizoctonia solani TaxID=456999 RepID=A0A8E8GTM3_9AGAM|nr:LAGLIDADG homing endonuclease [Rhizoctonia solani]